MEDDDKRRKEIKANSSGGIYLFSKNAMIRNGTLNERLENFWSVKPCWSTLNYCGYHLSITLTQLQIAHEIHANDIFARHLIKSHTDSSETPPTVNELYLHLHTVNHDGMTFIDTRSERFYVPSAWRPVLEDPSNLQIFFDYYAIAKPPISKELVTLDETYGYHVWTDPRLTYYDTLLENIPGLKEGKPAHVPIYDFKTIEVPSSRIVIIEGIYALSEKLRPLLDLRVSITGGVHFNLVKRVLRDIQRADQEPEEDHIQQISETHQIRRRQKLTQTTPDQPLDDEAVCYKVASDCPKGCVYSLSDSSKIHGLSGIARKILGKIASVFYRFE
ncbi:hypothetical protein Scep_001938 [Stephania cephalantha]|uniref:Phosphoribulokinase/uridine kinase domain-containing protein n=1 Tax=Stephania cephalantha TaxID=152367 RepID=A0AAP0Q3V3_9MAGN